MIEPGARTRKLDPFTFPSDTDFRFALLVAAVLCASMFIFNNLYLKLPGRSAFFLSTIKSCLSLSPTSEQLVSGLNNLRQTGQDEAFTRQIDRVTRCSGTLDLQIAAAILAGMVVMLLVALLILYVLSAWKIRREKLLPLTAADAPELLAQLDALCAEAGLGRHPAFVWNPLNPAVSGEAFGRPGKYYVALTGGLAVKAASDAQAFRSVVLHELAHVRNGDVLKAYFTLAVWWAFVVVGLVPFTATLLGESGSWTLTMALRAAVLVLLLWLTGCAVLRARESYADVRAADWADTRAGLVRLLDGAGAGQAEGWRGWIRLHPTAAQRKQVLNDPYPLFEAGTPEAFATGLAIAVGLPNAVSLAHELLTLTPLRGYSALVAAAIFGPLVAGILGLAVWRHTVASLTYRRTAPRTGRLAMALAAGLVLGQLVGFNVGVEATVSGVMDFIGVLVLHLAWGSLVALGAFLFFQWVRSVAQASFRGDIRPRGHRGLVAGFGLCWAAFMWLALLFQLYFTVGVAVPGGGALAALGSLTLPWWTVMIWLYNLPSGLTFVGVVALWATPLALHADPSAIRRSLKAAGIGALVFVGLHLGRNLIWPWLGLDDAARDQSALVLGVYVAPGVAAVVAAVVARGVLEFKAVYALFATFATGLLICASLLLFIPAPNSTVNVPSVILTQFPYTVQCGTLLTLSWLCLTGLRGLKRARPEDASGIPALAELPLATTSVG